MISIFFTKFGYYSKEQLKAVLEYEMVYKDEVYFESFSEGKVLQIYFVGPKKVVRNINNQNSLLRLEQDSVLLIENTLKVSEEEIKTSTGNLILDKRSFLQNLDEAQTVCIYHHNFSWSKRHHFFDSWFPDDFEIFSSDNCNGNPTPFMHERDIESPFNEIIPILKSVNQSIFSNKLKKLKDKYLATRKEKNQYNELTQKLGVLHKILGQNYNLKQGDQKTITRLSQSDFVYEESFEGLKKLRDQLLGQLY